jgi:hypothetical protein
MSRKCLNKSRILFNLSKEYKAGKCKCGYDVPIDCAPNAIWNLVIGNTDIFSNGGRTTYTTTQEYFIGKWCKTPKTNLTNGTRTPLWFRVKKNCSVTKFLQNNPPPSNHFILYETTATSYSYQKNLK